jgi:LuxR family maltose regulon positive regulatory protein
VTATSDASALAQPEPTRPAATTCDNAAAADRSVLPSRLRRPGLPRDVLRRPRLDDLLAELLDRCGVVVVTAAAGSGKTVQAQLFADTRPEPTSWITLDASHRSASRLLASISDALRAHRRADAEAAGRSAFLLDATTEEAAALAAGTVRAEPALLVVDECDHLDGSPEALVALRTFLDYSPDELGVLLLSRSDPPEPLHRRFLEGRIGLVDDVALRLTATETQQLADRIGNDEHDPETIRRATGGWAAGTVLGFRYGLHEQGLTRDLPAALMNDVLRVIPDAERQFLLDTSVPDVLTREAAAALCGPSAHSLWDTVRSYHLPATTVTRTTVVYHSLFRSFLHRQLLAQDPARHHRLVQRYAAFLEEHGHDEEATELYISIDDLDHACATAATAVDRLCARSDWGTFLRWAARLGEQRLHARPRMVAALVRSLFGQRRFDETVELVRSLDRSGRLRAAMEADPALLATAAWALQAHPAEARRFLDRYDGDYRADVVRFMLAVCTDLSPATPPLGSDWGDFERIMSWGLLLQGRITELQRFIPTDPDAPVVNPNVILAPVFSGDFDEARNLWNRVPQEIQDRPQSHFIESFLLLTEGEPELALSAVQVALTDSRKTSFFLSPAYEVFSGYILLRLGRIDDAIALLQAAVEHNAESGQTALLEWGQAYLGLAMIAADRVDAALPLLGECVRSMSRAHRRLFLPFAAACLSEAEARRGDEEAAHAAADLAYHSAAMTGSMAALLPALRVFPDVVTREDGRDPTGMRWRRLVVAPSARLRRRPSAGGNLRVRLQPFGPDRDIWIGGEPQHIGRMKIIELMALLVLHPGGIERGRLQTALFPDANLRNGGNHFRQIAFKFRQITGLSLHRREGNLVGLPPNALVESDDLRCEELLRATSWVTGEDRVTRLRSALELVRGPYLSGSDLEWAEERRNHLDVVQEEGRLELVRLLLELGLPEEARDECEAVLMANRYSDPGYRLLVQIEQIIGSESSVLAAYRRAVVALEELGLSPGDARHLLEGPPATQAGTRAPGAGGLRSGAGRGALVSR